MPIGFVLRGVALLLSLLALAVIWRWLRPTRAHVLSAVPAAILGAAGDWWVEVLICQAGIWEHTGRQPWLSIMNVPLEMPLAFIPAGMAGLWLLSLGSVLRTRFAPANVAAALFGGWCLLGISLDVLNLATGIGMRSTLPLSTLAPLYVAPFWILISATSPFFYWLILKIAASRLSILDVRGSS